MPAKGQFTPLKERLYRHFIPEALSGCWLWDGKVDKDGYGVMTNKHGSGGDYKAHRISYEVHIGEIPDGLDVCHSCNVRSCVNPAHLRADTRLNNLKDRIKHGRLQRAERHAFAKVTWEIVREIRAYTGSPRHLAAKHGISFSQAHRIKNMECWKDDSGSTATTH